MLRRSQRASSTLTVRPYRGCSSCCCRPCSREPSVRASRRSPSSRHRSRTRSPSTPTKTRSWTLRSSRSRASMPPSRSIQRPRRSGSASLTHSHEAVQSTIRIKPLTPFDDAGVCVGAREAIGAVEHVALRLVACRLLEHHRVDRLGAAFGPVRAVDHHRLLVGLLGLVLSNAESRPAATPRKPAHGSQSAQTCELSQATVRHALCAGSIGCHRCVGSLCCT